MNLDDQNTFHDNLKDVYSSLEKHLKKEVWKTDKDNKLIISEANRYHKNFMDLLREYSNLNMLKLAVDNLSVLIDKCNKEVERYLLKKPRRSPRVHFKTI